jgi:hypothetical protein
MNYPDLEEIFLKLLAWLRKFGIPLQMRFLIPVVLNPRYMLFEERRLFLELKKRKNSKCWWQNCGGEKQFLERIFFEEMWITPRGVGLQKFLSDVLWTIEEKSKEYNGLFELLKYKPTGLFNGLISTTIKISNLNISASSPLTYRIILKNPFDGNVYVLAVSDNAENIRKHWDYLLYQLIPQITSSKDKVSPKSDSNSLNIELDSELIQFLLSKVESLAQVKLIEYSCSHQLVRRRRGN